jgi:DNA-binding transcriptional ArsR family regulator
MAARPDPLWELVLAVRLMRQRPGDFLFTNWRTEASSQLQRAGLGEQLTLLRALLPHAGYFPDFLNPVAAGAGLDEGLDAICSTPRQRLRQDMAQLASTRPLPSTARSIAHGSPQSLADLAATLRLCYDLIVRPYEQDLKAAFERDRRTRLDALADGGVNGLFDSLRPFAYWTSGELCVPNHRSQTIALKNRGLLLIPAGFCINTPVTLFDSDLPPVLIYPVGLQFTSRSEGNSGSSGSLLKLIGATRTAILQAVQEQRRVMSTQLAKQLDVSIASISEQTRTLRESGLITSQRDQNRLFHQLTPLGQALLTKSTIPPH